jgi:tetratricopeptide (TPR) repeat protein
VEGKFEEAEKHGKIAIKLEPLSAICYVSYSLILSAAGKFNEALAACKTGIELDGNSYLCHIFAGSIHMVLQQYEEAISSYQAAIKLSNSHHFAVNALILTYCITAGYDKARRLMNS